MAAEEFKPVSNMYEKGASPKLSLLVTKTFELCVDIKIAAAHFLSVIKDA